MDFPIFHADFFGNRLVIGINAIIHVLINHPFAVGIFPLIVLMEWWAWRKNRPDWDDLLYKITFVCFVVTTTAGALTGVGIWFTTNVVAPMAIGSLIRIFYWAWFSEWIVFVSELVLIIAYFLLWKRLSGERKPAHIRLGIALAVMSWITLAIITGILGFMMDPGDWLNQGSFWSGFANGLWVPQMGFRTMFALAFAGSLALAFSIAFTAKGSSLRIEATRVFSGWTLFWLFPLAVWGVVYYRAIPGAMHGNLPVAFATQAYQDRFAMILQGLAATVIVSAALNVWGLLRPRSARVVVWLVPVIMFTLLLGYFERAREFVRKPYVIGYYMYSNGIRVADTPYLMRAGLLPNSEWVRHKEVTEQNKLGAGRDIFMLSCSRCHTITGINSVRTLLARMYPNQPDWDPTAIETFIRNIHAARPFMPPFVGTPLERRALAEYLASLSKNRDILPTTSSAAAQDEE